MAHERLAQLLGEVLDRYNGAVVAPCLGWMKAPGGTISFYWNSPNLTLPDGRAASLFTNEIYVPANYVDDDIPYLPVHELVHQFQWQYLTSAAVNIGVYGNSLRINWWMEATAEWASKEYALGRLTGTEKTTVISAAGANISQFLSTTSDRLSLGDFTIGLEAGAVSERPGSPQVAIPRRMRKQARVTNPNHRGLTTITV